METSDRIKVTIALIILLILILLLASVVYLVKFYNLPTNTNVVEGNITPEYDVNTYLIVEPVIYSYNDGFKSLNINKITFKNLKEDFITDFISKQTELLAKIDANYNEIKKNDNIDVANNNMNTNVTYQINENVLSIKYELVEKVGTLNYDNNYIITLNIDLKNNRILTTDEIFNQYNINVDKIKNTIYEQYFIPNLTDEMVYLNNEKTTKEEIIANKETIMNQISTNLDGIIAVNLYNKQVLLSLNQTKLYDEIFIMEDENQSKYVAVNY